MLKIVENKGYNAAQYYYEKNFADRIETLSQLPNYPDIERFAQQCIDLHTGYGHDAIAAGVYMDMIGKREICDEKFMEWAEKYGKA